VRSLLLFSAASVVAAAVAALLFGSAVWLLAGAGLAAGAAVWNYVPAGSPRLTSLTGEAADVLAAFVRSGFGRERWYVAPDEGADEAAKRFNAALDEAADKVRLLKEEEARLKTLLVHLDVGVVLVDGRDHVALVSIRAAALLRTTTDGAMGRPLLAVPGLLAAHAAVGESRRDGTARTVEISLAPDRQIEVRVTPLPERPDVLLLLRDMSEIRRLQAKESELLQNLSHELRTPVTSIRGFAETLLDQAVSEGDRARFLGIIAREAERMAEIIDDIQDLAAFDAHRPIAERRPVDVPALVAEVVEGWLEPFHQKGVDIEAVPTEPVTVLTDRGRVHEILMNLIDNALKYTPAGGRVRVGVELSDGGCVVSVADTGRGIPKEELTHIFDRFYRVDKARSRASGGTGLGLAIARMLADSVGAGLEVESTEGAGSTFRLVLMNAEPPA